MVDASVAVPSICLGQFLGPVELAEAIVDADPFHYFVTVGGHVLTFVLRIFKVDESVEA